jgi:hypothetical protein
VRGRVPGFSGNGQLRPARLARRTQSPADVAPIVKLAAILRLDRPSACSLRTSIIFCMGNLSPGMPPLLSRKGEARRIRRSPNGAGHPRPQPGRGPGGWSRSVGISGRNQLKRLVAINRKGRSRSVGTSGRDHSVRASFSGIWRALMAALGNFDDAWRCIDEATHGGRIN